MIQSDSLHELYFHLFKLILASVLLVLMFRFDVTSCLYKRLLQVTGSSGRELIAACSMYHENFHDCLPNKQHGTRHMQCRCSADYLLHGTPNVEVTTPQSVPRCLIVLLSVKMLAPLLQPVNSLVGSKVNVLCAFAIMKRLGRREVGCILKKSERIDKVDIHLSVLKFGWCNAQLGRALPMF